MSMNDTDPLPPPISAAPRPDLRRSATNRMLGGVCGGLSEFTGIDPILFRVGFVVVGLAGGAGVILYLALWLLLPDPGGAPGALSRWLTERPTNLVRNIAIGIAAFIALVVAIDSTGGTRGFVVFLAVVALIVLWARERNGPRTSAPAPEAGDGTYAVAVPEPRRPRRPRSPLGRITVSVALIVVGVLAAIDRHSGVDFSAAGYVAAALTVVGAGLLVGTFWGRSRGLIVLGVPLAILLIVLSTVDISVRDGFGQRNWQPATVGQVRDTYALGAGAGRLDLSAVNFDGADAATTVTVDAGYARILVPRDVDVTVDSQARVGQVRLFSAMWDGGDVRRAITDYGPDGPGGGRLNLIVDVHVGVVEVDRIG